MQHRRVSGLWALLLVALAAGPAFAQGSATSSITGVVVDTDGGFIPGATVVVKSESTGAENTTVTGSNGTFTVPALNVGTYTVTVSLQGFKTAVLKGVVVTAGVPGTVRAVLEVGGISETVVVLGAAEVIQTQSAAASTTINTKQITSLPVNSRSSLDFTQFLPGVQTASTVRNSTVNGLPQSSISITLDGVNIQDNTLKTTDGYFAIVSPRLDAIEEVTLTSAAQGADATGQGGVQIKFTTRSGSNQFSGSGYYFFQHDMLNSNTYANKVRGLPTPLLTLHQPGVRQGGPVVIPKVYDGRGQLFFFVNMEGTYQPSQITTNSQLMLPDAQNGIFKYNGGPAGGINLYALAQANGQTSTPDPIVLKLLQDIRASVGGSVLSEVTGNLNAERTTFQQSVGSPVYYPTIRMDYNVTPTHRVSGTWYRQRFTDTSFDTTNGRQPTFPGFPLYGTQGSWREAYTGTLRSTLGDSLVNEARVAYSGAPVQFGPYHNRDMYTGPLANQGGFALGISAAAGITNAGPNFTPSARNATTLNIANTLTLLKGSHNLSLGGEFGQYDVWLDTYGTRAVPTIAFGTQTGDPALAMFTAANFPGSSATDRNNAAALYAVLTGRVTQIGATARLDANTGQYVYQGDSRAEGRLRQVDLFVQDNWRVRPNLSLNLGLRYALQFPFYARNNSYSTATVNDVWGVSGYIEGCDMSNPTRDTCNLFRPGTMTGTTPSFQNLGAGVQAYHTDWDNVAPSVGANWTPSASGGWLQKVLGNAGDTSISGGFSRAFDRRGMNDFTGVFGSNPGLTITGTRSTGNGNLTVPLLFRDGYLGAPSTCPPLPAPKPTGCLLAAPEYPLTNQTFTGSVNTFDPYLQVPYSDTWTVGFQRALGRTSAVEIRYVGTRSRAQWETFNYNEPNILDNGFLTEFRAAQANLQSHIAAGCGASSNPCSFAYRGPGTGTTPLPIYLAYFSGTSIGLGGQCASAAACATMYNSANWTSSSFINPLALYNGNPFTPAGTNSGTGLSADPTRRANAIAAGLPVNFFHANPDMLGGANATGNRGFTRYDGLQLQYRRRLSQGWQFDANYVYGYATESRHYSFRVPRIATRVTGQEGDISHAFKATGVWDLPFGQGRRFAGNVGAGMDRLVGGWQISGTARIQSGRLFDLGNVRVVGMTMDEVQSLFKIRKESDTIVYAWPQAIIDETIKAYSTNPTSPTGYGALGPPSGKYFAPANNPECIETISNNYGDCGVRSLVVTGPMIANVDLSLRKRVAISGRVSYEFSLDVFNVMNRVTWVPTVGIGSTTLANWQAGLPGSARTMQIGTRISW